MKKETLERLDEVHRIVREALDEPPKTTEEILFFIICFGSLGFVPIIALLPYQYVTFAVSSLLVSLVVIMQILIFRIRKV